MNKTLFRSGRAPRADAENLAGGVAYKMPDKHALVQLAVTGCFNGTYYARGEAQLDTILDLAAKVPEDFLARTALYARERGYMKDMPAVLCAVLQERGSEHLPTVFRRVIDNGKMLRNFVQAVRSGAVGRKSFRRASRRLLQEWFAKRKPDAIFRASVGRDPTMRDLLRMIHPRPESKVKDSLYGYLVGKTEGKRNLPECVRAFEKWKAAPEEAEVPNVPFQMLTGVEIPDKVWWEIARTAKWQMTRMNLNTFLRHGVFKSKERTRAIAARLRDPEKVKRARAFPYQLLAAYRNVSDGVPVEVQEALQDAMEIATENVPALAGDIVVCPDVSGSMSSPITGHRKGATTQMRCIDIAALVSACVMRGNAAARVIPFEGCVVPLRLNPRDSVMTNAERLASIGGGSTCCSAPLALLNREKASVDLVIFVSDYESWVESASGLFGYRSSGTAMLEEWKLLKKRCPKARLVCIDVEPQDTSQVKEHADVLQVGGFSDAVFGVVAAFLRGELAAEHWVGEIEKISLE